MNGTRPLERFMFLASFCQNSLRWDFPLTTEPRRNRERQISGASGRAARNGPCVASFLSPATQWLLASLGQDRAALVTGIVGVQHEPDADRFRLQRLGLQGKRCKRWHAVLRFDLPEYALLHTGLDSVGWAGSAHDVMH